MSLRNAVRNVARRGRFLSGDSTAPTVLSTTVAANGTTVTVVFSEACTGSGDYGLDLGYGYLVYSSGSGTNTFVFTTNGVTVLQGATVTSYYDPGNITDLAGNPLAAFSGGTVTNNSTQVPTVTDITVGTNGTTVTVHFSDAMTGGTGLTLTLNALGTLGLTYASGTGTSELTFTAAGTIYASETVTCAYVAGNLVAANGGAALQNFSGTAVTNNSTQFNPSTLTGYVAGRWVAIARVRGLIYSDLGTTSVTTDGSLVRRIRDPFNGANIDAPSDAARPTLKNPAGSTWCIRGGAASGIYMLWTGNTTGTVFYAAMRITTDNVGTSNARYMNVFAAADSDFNTAAAFIPFITHLGVSDDTRAYCNSAALATLTTSNNTKYTMESWVTGGNNLMSLNGSDTGTTATGMNLNSDRVGFGIEWNGGAAGNSTAYDDFATMWTTTIPSAGNRTSMQTLLGTF